MESCHAETHNTERERRGGEREREGGEGEKEKEVAGRDSSVRKLR